MLNSYDTEKFKPYVKKMIGKRREKRENKGGMMLAMKPELKEAL